MVIKGIKRIKLGSPEADGGMGLSLADFCNTVGGTASLETATGDDIELLVEESSDPDHSESLDGPTILKWRIANFDPAVMAKVLGGTTSGTGANKSWEKPDVKPVIEQSIEIDTAIPVTGKIEFPRASISARIIAPLDKKQYGNIEITAKILKPKKDGVSSMKWTPGA